MMTLENLSVFPGKDFAGREDGGEVRLDLKLAFDNMSELRSFLVRNSISTTEIDRVRPE
jgi:hypothetical protein